MTKNNSDEPKNDVARKRHEDSIKYLYFSRYLMIRYIVAIFFFANMFWLILDWQANQIPGIIVSAIMTVYAGIAAIEQLAKMHNHKRDVPITRIYFWVQVILNLLLLIILFTPLFKVFLPFVQNQNSKLLFSVFFLIGIILCLLSEWRIDNIRHNRDRYKKVIDTFKKNRQ